MKHLRYNSNVIDRRRYFEPITATTALAALTAAGGTAGVGAGIGSMFGLFGKGNKDQNDPLAGIRAQLEAIAGRQQGLAEQVPGMVASQKKLIGERFGEERTKGIQDIGEETYATRGLGRTSIYDRLRTELIDKLARSQAEAELAADYQGLTTQSNILTGASNVLGSTSSMYPAKEEPSILSKILGMGSSLVGQQLGLQGLKDIISPEITPRKYDGVGGRIGGFDTYLEELKNKPGYLLTQ